MALTFLSPACRLAVTWRVFCSALLHCYRVFSNDKSGGRYRETVILGLWISSAGSGGTTKISFFSNRPKLLSVLTARRSLVNASTFSFSFFLSATKIALTDTLVSFCIHRGNLFFDCAKFPFSFPFSAFRNKCKRELRIFMHSWKIEECKNDA